MTEKLDAAESGELAWDRDLRWARGLVAGVAAALFGVVILCDLAVNEEWLAPTVIGALTLIGIFAVPGRRFRRLDADASGARGALGVVRALDRGLPAPLGRPAGDARAVEADPRLRRRVRHRGADDLLGSHPRAGRRERHRRRCGWYAYAFTGGFDGSSFDGSSFSSSFASQVAPESSSSGGGGGFSGGGGGGLLGRRGRRFVVGAGATSR